MDLTIEQLIDLRKAAGIRQVDVATHMGVTRQYIDQVEHRRCPDAGGKYAAAVVEMLRPRAKQIASRAAAALAIAAATCVGCGMEPADDYPVGLAETCAVWELGEHELHPVPGGWFELVPIPDDPVAPCSDACAGHCMSGGVCLTDWGWWVCQQ